jgi:hypothetical protein
LTLEGVCSPKPLLTLSPDSDPLWVHLYLHGIAEVWAAMIVADGEPPPEPGNLKGLAFFGATREEAEDSARTYLRRSELQN